MSSLATKSTTFSDPEWDKSDPEWGKWMKEFDEIYKGRESPYSDKEMQLFNISTRIWQVASKIRRNNENNNLIKVGAEVCYLAAEALALLELPVGMISSLVIANPLSQGVSFGICGLLDFFKILQPSEGSHTNRFAKLRNKVNRFVALNTQTIFQSLISSTVGLHSHKKSMSLAKRLKSKWFTEKTVNKVMTLWLGELFFRIDQGGRPFLIDQGSKPLLKVKGNG